MERGIDRMDACLVQCYLGPGGGLKERVVVSLQGSKRTQAGFLKLPWARERSHLAWRSRANEAIQPREGARTKPSASERRANEANPAKMADAFPCDDAENDKTKPILAVNDDVLARLLEPVWLGMRVRSATCLRESFARLTGPNGGSYDVAPF
jgi:hypothetical protein